MMASVFKAFFMVILSITIGFLVGEERDDALDTVKSFVEEAEKFSHIYVLTRA